MYIVGFLFFTYSVILVIFFDNKISKVYLKYPYYLIFLLLSCFIALNVQNLSRDYLNYSLWFEAISDYNLLEILLLGGVDSGKDSGFQFLVAVIQEIISSKNSVIYFIFSYLILFFKYKISSFLDSNLAIVLVFWLFFAQTFVLFEITQIRAGLAICISTYAFMRALFYKKNRLNLLLFLIAISIHISTLVIFVFYLLYLIKQTDFSKFTIIFLILSSLIFKYFFSTSMGLFFLTYFSNNIRFSDYLEGNDSLSLFSVFLITKILVITILITFWSNITNAKKCIVFLSAVGCFFQIAFSANIVFGLRFAELFVIFSLLTFVFPLQIKELNEYLKYLYFISIVALSWAFYYSSTKIILG